MLSHTCISNLINVDDYLKMKQSALPLADPIDFITVFHFLRCHLFLIFAGVFVCS